MLRRLSIAVLTTTLAIVPQLGHASRPECPPHVVAGIKATQYIAIPANGAAILTDQAVEYGRDNGLLYGSVGTEDPDETPPYNALDRLLQSKSSGVMITVITTNRDNVAKMTVETTCSAIENWRPYWRDFKSFISKSGYRALPKGAR